MSLKIVPFENLRTVSYSHSVASMAVSLAVSTQCTKVADSQPPSQPQHDGIGRACAQRRAAKTAQ